MIRRGVDKDIVLGAPVLNFYLFGDMKIKRMKRMGKKKTKGTVDFFGKRSGKNKKKAAQLLHEGN